MENFILLNVADFRGAYTIAHLSTSIACCVTLLSIYHSGDKELEKQAARVAKYTQKVEENRR